jgi:3-hydroxyisobutyrate dehydrogenase-like beta-hydroxyacid dehydrogenase
MEIGFIGLGAMGSGIARNLLRAGNSLTVYNRSPERTEAFAREGATVARTPAEAASRGIVVSMLADDAAVEAVTFGEAGVISGLPRGGVHISMSTISVALSERLQEAHGRAGQSYLAAPVFGRPDIAAAGKLFVLAAGDAAVIERLQPILNAVGQRVFSVGPRPSNANLIKLTGNFLITCVIEGFAEAFAVTAKAGIDSKRVYEIFTESLFSAPVYKTYGTVILEERYKPPGFKLPLGLKDNRLLLQAAEHLAVPLPFASLVRDRLLTAMAHGGADLDWSALALCAIEDAGLSSLSKPQ